MTFRSGRRVGWFLLLVLVAGLSIGAGRTESASFQIAPGRIQVARLCTSVPIGVPSLRPISAGIDSAVVLATENWRTRFRVHGVTLLPPLQFDDASPSGATYDPGREARNARACARRPDTFGYIGPVNSGATGMSEPILNRAGMVQISPSNTLPVLTSPAATIRAELEPATEHQDLAYVTYYRTIGTDALQGPSGVAYLRRVLHVRNFVLIAETDQYSGGIAGAVQSYALRIGFPASGILHVPATRTAAATRREFRAVADAVVAADPGGVYLAGEEAHNVQPNLILRDIRDQGYEGPVMMPDADVAQSFLAGLRNPRKLYGTIPGIDPSAVARPFRRAFHRRFHRPLQEYDAEAYDAANIELHALYEALLAGKVHGPVLAIRRALLPYIAHTRWRGATGVTTFDRNGDTTNRPVSVYGIRGNQWAYSGLAPRVTGVPSAG